MQGNERKYDKYVKATNKVAIGLYVLKVVITLAVMVFFSTMVQSIFDAISIVAFFVCLLGTIGVYKQEIAVDPDHILYRTKVPVMLMWMPRVIEIFMLFVVMGESHKYRIPALVVTFGIDAILTGYAFYDQSKYQYEAFRE